jgi:Chaperone of endosialidase
MADSKISALPASTTPLAGTEVLPIVQSSTTKQVSVANLTAGRAVTAASLAAGSTSTPASSRTLGFGAKTTATGGIQVYQATSNSDWAINASSGSICNFYSDTGSALTYAGAISVAGNITTYGSISDYRLKENVQPMTGALEKVQALNPVTYTFKNGGQVSQGFIAHELQAVIPDAVTGEKDAVNEDGSPNYQGVDTSFLVATLTSAIQEQQALIESLITRLMALENK